MNDSFKEWEWTTIKEFIAKDEGFNSVREAIQSIGESKFTKRIESVALSNPAIVFRTAAIGGGAKIKRQKTINISKSIKNEIFVHENEDLNDFYILNGEQILFYKDRFENVDGELIPVQLITDIWTDISWTGIANEGGLVFKNSKKPELLLKRILEIFTNPNDLVLDSFLGSGTTAVVAHKMGRRYIGIELGVHAKTHCIPRLEKVIEGEQSGISKAVNWQGGGGFRFYRLGEPIFNEDGSIRRDIKFPQLAAHVWFTETGIPMQEKITSPLLGVHENKAYYLLYNGILGDKKANGGNVLTHKILEALPPYEGEKVIYGERSLFNTERLKTLNIVFKQTPYDIKER